MWTICTFCAATMPMPISPPRITESWIEMLVGQVVPPSALSNGPKPRRRSKVTWSNSMNEQPARMTAAFMCSLTAEPAAVVPVAGLPPSTAKPRTRMWVLFWRKKRGGEVGGPAGPQLERAPGADQGQAGPPGEVQAGIAAELVARAGREDQRAPVLLRRDPGVERRARVRRAGRVDRGGHGDADGRRRRARAGRRRRARAGRRRGARARCENDDSGCHERDEGSHLGHQAALGQ